VSNAETIAKLNTLLARVTARSVEPRRSRAATPITPMAPPPPPARPAPVRIEPEMANEPATLPPPARPADESPEIMVEIDAQEPIEEALLDGSTVVTFDSRERLVAAEPVAAIAEPARGAPAAIATVLEQGVEGLSGEPESAEEEEIPEAPASSRRPVAPQPEERLAEMAFGADELQPLRHTPPPKSGPLPAAAADDFDGDVTGVRGAAPVSVADPPTPRSSKTPASPAMRELVPEVTAASLAASDRVAHVVGEAQRFAPSTFVALLDASLSL
jgi:hypothetical protein